MSTEASGSRALILTRSTSPSLAESRTVSSRNEQWQPILHASNQIVLYNPQSHALSIASAPTNIPPAMLAHRHQRAALTESTTRIQACPYCNQNLPQGFHGRSPPARFRRSRDVDEDEDRWETVVDRLSDSEEHLESRDTDPAYHSRASDYFQLLAIANDQSSQPPDTRISSLRIETEDYNADSMPNYGRQREGKGKAMSPSDEYHSEKGAFPAEKMAEGYFKSFFKEEYKLGMGANGSVFLCQHVLDGNSLGHFAVKKIAVGESHSYLFKILKEVRLLERLRHPNIITYHHAWLETSQFSSFGPKVPTLFVLMQWAEGGSLDDFIDVRLGRKPAHIHRNPFLTLHSDPFSSSRSTTPSSSVQGDPLEDNEHAADCTPTQSGFAVDTSPAAKEERRGAPASDLRAEDPHSRSAKIRAFRAFQLAPPEEKERMRRENGDIFGGPTENLGAVMSGANGLGGTGRREWTAVHLLSADEVKSLFHDVVEGLGFLHSKSILHLDLKPGNVLLTWDEGRLIPRAMLSDFGTSRDMIHSSLKRSGNTGTLEYTAPESLPSPQTGLLQHIDSKADMWSLGMILHKLLFFKLPYRYAAEGDANGEPIGRDEEGDKMIRLEKEVLTYDGFKSNPSLVSNFEGRRLPRAFLVLLENLLNKIPAVRPTCERVAGAIREGKFDPLQEVSSSNMSLARPRVADGPPKSTYLPADTAVQESSVFQEKHPLALPSPGYEDDTPQSWFRWGALTTLLDLNRRRHWTITIMKLIRSVLLVTKVLTIRGMCPHPSTRPRPILVAFLLALAIGDTVLDHHDWNVQIRRRGSKHGKSKQEDAGPSRRPMMRLLSRFGSGIWITVGLTMLHFTLVWLTSNGSKEGLLGELRMLWGRACCVVSDETF